MDNEFWNNLFQETLKLFVDPEVTKRLEGGQIDRSWRMFAAQVVMNVGEPVRVRLNEEVTAVFTAMLPGQLAEVGKTISLKDIESIANIELAPADANAGHITMIALKGDWYITFDLRYNRARILEYLVTTDEFLATAHDALSMSRLRPFVENLLAAAEHLARCYLMVQPDPDLLKKGSSHNLVKTRFNYASKLGNVNSAYADTLNELFELRNPARYMTRDFWIPPWRADELLRAVQRLRSDVERRLPPRYVARSSG
jgi:hypothetical protein